MFRSKTAWGDNGIPTSDDVIFLGLYSGFVFESRSMLRCIRDLWIPAARLEAGLASPLLPVRIPRTVPLCYRPDLLVYEWKKIKVSLSMWQFRARRSSPGCVSSLHYEVDNSYIWGNRWKSRETRVESLIRDNRCYPCRCPCNIPCIWKLINLTRRSLVCVTRSFL